LEGFRLLLQFLVEQEADYLCAVPRHTRSPRRTNYRIGYYPRKLRILSGAFCLRVPQLKYFCPRVSIAKRAKRLSPEILETLARVLGGTPSMSSEAVSLIRAIWTLKLSDGLLVTLAEKLIPILEHWRSSTGFQPVVSTSNTGFQPVSSKNNAICQPAASSITPAPPLTTSAPLPRGKSEWPDTMNHPPATINTSVAPAPASHAVY